MVKDQLIARGINDARVLEAMRRIKRHEFIPLENRANAYDDAPCPIGEGQTISQPYMVALMSELLQLRGHERVLEIGTGCGYQTAILAELAPSVVSVERIALLAKNARETLGALGYANIEFIMGDGSEKFKEDAGFFDAIMVTAAVPRISPHWLSMLNAGGRLLAPIGSRESQVLTLVTNSKKAWETREFCRCVFVPLIGSYGFH